MRASPAPRLRFARNLSRVENGTSHTLTRFEHQPIDGASSTVGVDLAAQQAETAACVLSWLDGHASVEVLTSGLSDADLVELIDQSQPAKVAIDAPFGWPVPFVDAIASYAATGEWPTDEIAPLRLRETDRAVIAATRQQPLSVSADRIAVTAMRCARLLTRLRGAGHTITRDGRAGLAAEVYPAAALRVWRLDPRGYKGRKPEAVAKRQALVADLLAACAGWLDAEDHHERLVTSDHHLDALICAVLARVILCGHSAPVPVESEHSAVLEGWIHLPRESALDELAAAASV